MYIFVREDLSLSQQIVQAGHATFEIGTLHPANTHSPHFVLLGAKTELKLLEIAEWLISHNVEFKMFYEPDISSYTALATQPMSGETRNKFKKFKLLVN